MWVTLSALVVLTVGAAVVSAVHAGDAVISGRGTVRYLDMAGGFYGIVAEDGAEYLPLKLDEAFKVDGLQITFSAEPAPDTFTVHMWGTPVELLAIRHHEPNARDDRSELVRGNTAFALALYRQLTSERENLVFSPFSISASLAMTYAGATGKTADEIAEVLRFTLPEERLHNAFHDLLAALEDEQQDVELALANALWGQQGYGFCEVFVELVRTRYGAGLREVDYTTDPEAARVAINAWVAEITRDRIAELLSPNALDELTRLVLVNAIYFQGDWVLPFDPERTTPADFHLQEGENVKVPMMAREGWFPYAQFEELQVLEMLYEGEELSMAVFLPRRGMTLAGLEAQLTAENVTRWLAALDAQPVMVHLPKFTVRSGFSLVETLKAMGMSLAFGPQADFSGMDGRSDLVIDDVIHQALVEVDEQGAEAAAATAVVMAERSALAPSPVEFRADRPFMYLLRDRATGSILFMGRVTDPR